ncbi:amidohydrolase family protein [Streptomyces sp. NPDC001508]|uniref:metal-dependent hydrolase family protein n=1 Tax=Streptomyces sp. NPDC001508 TaxID=3154656 RepID=UPI003322FD67
MTEDRTGRSPDPIVFTGARVIDGTGAAPAESVAVVVQDGRFTYVGPESSRPRIDAATAIDLGGRTLLPGFFDCHLHFLMDSNADFTGRLLTNRPIVTVFQRAQRMRETLHAGITTARDLGGIEAGYRDAVAQGLIEGPRLHVALRLMSHTGGHADFRTPSGYDPSALLEPFSELADDPTQVRLATRKLLRDGADVIKICATGGVNSPNDQPEDEGLTTEEISVVVDETRRHRGRPVAAHAQGAQGIKNALRGGVTSIEHGYLIDDEGIDLMLENDAFLVPTLSTFHGDGGRFTPAAYEKKMRMADAAMERLSEAVRRGAKVALGTDAGAGPHAQNLRELGHLTKLGLTPLEAIRAGTLNAAQLMGLDQTLGTVEEGKTADLVVCDGDPLADIDVLGDPANVVLVMQEGRIAKHALPEAVR